MEIKLHSSAKVFFLGCAGGESRNLGKGLLPISVCCPNKQGSRLIPCGVRFGRQNNEQVSMAINMRFPGPVLFAMQMADSEDVISMMRRQKCCDD